MKLSKVHSKYGAPMGRATSTRQPAPGVKFHLSRVRINQGGYDSGGAYWGTGRPLYHAWGEGETEVLETFVRALTRDGAKEAVRGIFAGAEFHR